VEGLVVLSERPPIDQRRPDRGIVETKFVWSVVELPTPLASIDTIVWHRGSIRTHLNDAFWPAVDYDAGTQTRNRYRVQAPVPLRRARIDLPLVDRAIKGWEARRCHRAQRAPEGDRPS
jgi:hypothetical protein